MGIQKHKKAGNPSKDNRQTVTLVNRNELTLISFTFTNNNSTVAVAAGLCCKHTHTHTIVFINVSDLFKTQATRKKHFSNWWVLWTVRVRNSKLTATDMRARTHYCVVTVDARHLNTLTIFISSVYIRTYSII